MTTPEGMAGSAAGTMRRASFASPVGLDRLIRKEVALGSIRERPVPQGHIGLAQIAPFLNVASDDVIFDYLKDGLQEGLAPARAEDAEAELAQKDDLFYGQGRASVIDWSLKDKYTPSDVMRYRDALLIQQRLEGTADQLTLNDPGNTVAEFNARVARHDALRRRKLDNRLEWLIMQAIENAVIAYNDGKIKFSVDFGRPAGQQNQAPASGLWNTTTFDPIGDILAMNDTMYNTYGVRLRRAITSRKVMQSLWRSDRFIAMAGVVGGTPSSPIDLNYLLPGWGPQRAIDMVQEVTGVRFIEYDSVWRSRPIGSATITNNRFLSENKIFFLPEESDLGEVDATDIGFAKTLTSPHPEGNWQPGYYEWEDEQRDPWMQVRGTGIKAFPVFPYMEYTYTMTVLP
jgi:hypothetical protein